MGLATSMENAKIPRAFGKARRKYNTLRGKFSQKCSVIFFLRVRFYQVLLPSRADAMLCYQLEFIRPDSRFPRENSRVRARERVLVLNRVLLTCT